MCVTSSEMFFYFTFLFVLFHHSFQLTVASESETIVNLSSGTIRGKVQLSPNGKISQQFLGIPYAKAPLGKLRFAPPEPVEAWNGVRDALTDPPICPQPPMPPPLNQTVAGLLVDEDCLFLNVFSPSNAGPKSKLAVMVFIHGGAFTMGNAPNEFASILATLHDVIIVGIQYRIGVLGFFNVPGTETKGNYGLMDQVEALKWVQINIAKFGGDPSRVTIFGESAGGISVSLLMLIPQAQNLFHRVIAQSGTAAALHGCYRVNETKSVQKYLEFLNCSLGSYLDCVRGKSSADILKAQMMISSPEVLKELGFASIVGPVVDDHYIRDIPRDLLLQGKFHRLETIFGYTSNEGGLFPTMFFSNLPVSMYTKQFFKAFLYLVRSTPYDENELVKAALLQQYTKHSKPETPEIIREQIMDCFSDNFATAPTALTLEAFADANVPGYMYIFNHRSKYSVWPEWAGVNHGDEIPYMFGVPFADSPSKRKLLTTGFTEMEKGLSQFMMKLWTNFAKSGNPNSKENGQDLVMWPKYTKENKEYLEIALEWKVGKNYRPEQVAFWNDFLPKLSAHKLTNKEQKDKKETKDEL